MDAKVDEKEAEKKGEQHRRRIGPGDVTAAVAAAKTAEPGDEKIYDLNDDEQTYLTLRRRGKRVSWVVRAYKQTKVIGSATGIHVDPRYLNLRDAREVAKRVYAELSQTEPKRKKPAPVPEKPKPWTTSEVCLKFTAMMARGRWLNGRTKPPSPATVDDIRRAFSHGSLHVLGPMLVTDLNREIVDAARDGIVAKREGSGVHHARMKFVVWFRSAMSWAATKHPTKSGLVDGTDRWWERLTTDDPSDEEQRAIAAKKAVRLQRKSDINVEIIGAVLARHEEYCRGRTGRDMVGPGVRFGLWWANCTANRRYTTVKLERSNFQEQDEFGELGWGRAMWEEDQMKAKSVFWLPLPPVVRDIALHSMQDWKQLVANEHGDMKTRWVFASTRREGRDPGNEDVSVYPNSLNKHVARMRTDGALDGLHYYSLHLARTAMTKFMEKHVSPRAASLTLAHAFKDSTDEEMAPTTRDFYSVSQHMEEKAVAMRAWSDALIEAFLKAGGTMPAPAATIRKPKTPSRRLASSV